jgi:beta-lactamase class A
MGSISAGSIIADSESLPVELETRQKIRRRKQPPLKRKLTFLCAAAFVSLLVAWPFFHPSQNQARQPSAEGKAAMDGAAPGAAVVVQPALPTTTPMPFALETEMSDLAAQLKQEIDKPSLHTGIFVAEAASGRYVQIDAQQAFSAASMIKLPVFVKLLLALDRHDLSLDQTLVIRSDLIGGGSGWLQWRRPGSKVSLKETAELMMTISDNTATNMIIDVLGGKNACNQDFVSWGLSQTKINNLLPDLTGTNTTSPYDLGLLLAKIDGGQILSKEMRAYMLSVLARNRHRTLLPMGIPRGTQIADKTGDIGSLVGDAGIITAKSGQRYIIVVAVARPFNDRRANALIRQVSKDTYVAVTGDADGVKDLLVKNDSVAAAPRHHRRHRHGSRHRQHQKQ